MRALVTASQITKSVATIGCSASYRARGPLVRRVGKVFPPPLDPRRLHRRRRVGQPHSGARPDRRCGNRGRPGGVPAGTRFGLAILASADDPVAAQLMGVPRAKVSAVTWAIAGALSVIACLLIEPTVGVLSPGFASTLFIGGLTAALLGGLTSLPGRVRRRAARRAPRGRSASSHFVSYTQVPGPQNLAMLVHRPPGPAARPQGLLGARE